jgi:hypothetical protein
MCKSFGVLGDTTIKRYGSAGYTIAKGGSIIARKVADILCINFYFPKLRQDAEGFIKCGPNPTLSTQFVQQSFKEVLSPES